MLTTVSVILSQCWNTWASFHVLVFNIEKKRSFGNGVAAILFFFLWILSNDFAKEERETEDRSVLFILLDVVDFGVHVAYLSQIFTDFSPCLFLHKVQIRTYVREVNALQQWSFSIIHLEKRTVVIGRSLGESPTCTGYWRGFRSVVGVMQRRRTVVYLPVLYKLQKCLFSSLRV